MQAVFERLHYVPTMRGKLVVYASLLLGLLSLLSIKPVFAPDTGSIPTGDTLTPMGGGHDTARYVPEGFDMSVFYFIKTCLDSTNPSGTTLKIIYTDLQNVRGPYNLQAGQCAPSLEGELLGGVRGIWYTDYHNFNNFQVTFTGHIDWRVDPGKHKAKGQG